MPRKARVEFAEAVYYLLDRGDRQEVICAMRPILNLNETCRDSKTDPFYLPLCSHLAQVILVTCDTYSAMNDDLSKYPPETECQRKRGPHKWLLEYLRLEQEGWNLLQDRGSSFAQAWFEWLNWIVILAALQVVATKYHSRIAAIVCWGSFWVIYYHFYSIYSRNARKIVDPVTGVHRVTMLGWFVAIIPAAVSAFLSLLLARAVSNAMP